jgi:hypothetical protein
LLGVVLDTTLAARFCQYVVMGRPANFSNSNLVLLFDLIVAIAVTPLPIRLAPILASTPILWLCLALNFAFMAAVSIGIAT